MTAPRLTGTALRAFLAEQGIHRLDPVDRSSASGEDRDDKGLDELLRKGDPLAPTRGWLAEDQDALLQLRTTHGVTACFPLTPDGHLAAHQPILFDSPRAVEQAIVLLEANLATDDREEALTATWLGLAYHNSDHPADFGGLVWDQQDGHPLCCYLDVKRTESATARRAKLEQRAQERKFGMMALTVTRAAEEGFRRYPGRGKPGLIVTLLHTTKPIRATESAHAMNWFLGVTSSYPASAARWGFGGPNEVRLPEPLMAELDARMVEIRGIRRSWRELLSSFRDYDQYRQADGTWDRETFQATLEAMALTARYLLMNDNVLEQVETTLQNLQPSGIDTPLTLEDFHPGESFATFFGRRADRAMSALKESQKEVKQLGEALREKDDQLQQVKSKVKQKDDLLQQEKSKVKQKDDLLQQEKSKVKQMDDQLQEEKSKVKQKDSRIQKQEADLKEKDRQLQQVVARRRLRGHADEEIAEDMGFALGDFRQRFPLEPA